MHEENVKQYEDYKEIEKISLISEGHKKPESNNFLQELSTRNNDKRLIKNRRKKGFYNSCKFKKEPLPMKLRALPESFWQQPNEPARQSPGTVFPDLPIICPEEETENEQDYYCESSSDSPSSLCSLQESITKSQSSKIISTANTDLLFSLFSVVETSTENILNNNDEKTNKLAFFRRGRPKKFRHGLVKGIRKHLRDEDPCLISTVTEALLPLLPTREKGKLLENNNNNVQQKQALITVSINNERTNSLNMAFNTYSHILSEVVIRL